MKKFYLMNKAFDLDCNFYNANVQKLDRPYTFSQEFPSLSINTEQNDFPILYLNIRCIKNTLNFF